MLKELRFTEKNEKRWTKSTNREM
uniref:Uncharacterized protein n=1 Tax=Anguilla anguilla TaxID=7936 RepID=A0A0E9PCG6_ANGAN